MSKNKKEKKHHLFIWFLLFIGILLIYSRYVATSGLVIKEYSIVSNKLPTSFNGLKIVHFSDLHYGTTVMEDELKNVVDNINMLNPDIIVFTGDLVDNNYNASDKEIELIASELERLSSSIGLYATEGNHDENSKYDEIIEKTNIKILNNTNDIIYYNNGIVPIRIVGLSDSLTSTQDLDSAFYYEDDNLYTIVLTHEPDDYDKITKNIDLFLAGHSHNGQIRLPFIGAIYTPVGAKKYYDNKYEIDDTTIFISSGIGTSKIKFRFLNKPSINFYRLYNQ